MNELQRQQALLAVLAGGAAQDGAAQQVSAEAVAMLRERGTRAARGLEAYRANVESIADRALASIFPTVQAMVGADDFRHLAKEFWHVCPPERGDLGEWGDGFAAWLAAHAGLHAWPYLADSARLELALHRHERAADAVLDVDSLRRLESADPAQLRLVLMPGVALLRSPWPIAAIHRAHQLEGEAAESAFEAVREAIAARRGEQVLVARRGWRAAVHAIDPATADWTADVLDGIDLGTALTRAGEGFDFAAWLATALRESWLKEVAAAPPISRGA